MLKLLFSKLPLVGGLTTCTVNDHWRAVQEIFVTLIFAMFPVLIGTAVVWVMKSSGIPLGFKGAFYSTIESGELLIYATALLAPIVWMATTDPPGAKSFPSKLSHIMLVCCVLVVAAVVFGLQRTGQQIRTDVAFEISVWSFIGSIALLYLATVYHNGRIPNPPAEFRKDESSFVNEYKEHSQ